MLRVRARDGAGNQSDWTQAVVRFGGTREAPAGITRTLNWASGFAVATALTELPDGRLLVAQQSGAVRVVQSDGRLLSAPMLTLTVDTFQDRGLLGVVAHPQFASNGYALRATDAVPASQGGLHYRLSRFTVNGNTAIDEVVLANLPTVSSAHPWRWRSALWQPTESCMSGVGDAGVTDECAEPEYPIRKAAAVQRRRQHPERQPVLHHAGQPGVRRMGLRPAQPVHPCRAAGRPAASTSTMWARAQWEEIDVAASGANYGWPASRRPQRRDGRHHRPVARLQPQPSASPPGSGLGGFFVGSCVIGGAFYPDGGPVPGALARRLLLHRLRYGLRRLSST